MKKDIPLTKEEQALLDVLNSMHQYRNKSTLLSKKISVKKLWTLPVILFIITGPFLLAFLMTSLLSIGEESFLGQVIFFLFVFVVWGGGFALISFKDNKDPIQMLGPKQKQCQDLFRKAFPVVGHEQVREEMSNVLNRLDDPMIDDLYWETLSVALASFLDVKNTNPR